MSQFKDRLRAIGRNAVVAEGGRGEVPSVAPRDMIQGNPTRQDGGRLYEEKERDRLLLGSAAFTAKYGAQANTERLLPAASEYADPVERSEVQNAPRDLLTTTSDSLRSIGGGVASGVGTLINLGVLATDYAIEGRYRSGGIGENPFFDEREVVANVAKAAGATSDFIVSGQSDQMKRKDEVAAITKRAAMLDNQRNFDKSDKGFVARLRKIGRDVSVEAINLKNNPGVAGDLVAEAVGSLVPSLVASGGTSAIAAKTLAKTGLKEESKERITRFVTAGTVGVMEGQGAYDSTMTEVLSMDDADLMESSVEYAELRNDGIDEKEAKLIIGDKAGDRARLIQTGVASLAGYTVAKFEGNPLGRRTLRDNAKTLLSQTAEEAFQSGSGQMSSNIGLQAFADKDRDITEGVGESITQGALGGFGATGVITAPTTAVSSVKEVANIVGTKAREVIAERANKVRSEIEETGPANEKETTEKLDRLDDLLSQASELSTLRDNATPEELEAEYDAVKALDDLPLELTDTASEAFVQSTGTFAEDVVQGSRIKTLRKVASKLQSGAYKTPETLKAAAEFVSKEIDNVREYVVESQLKGKNATDTEQGVTELVADVMKNKVFSQGYTAANNTLSEVYNSQDSSQEVTPRELVTNPVGISPQRLANTDVSGLGETGQKVVSVVRAISPQNTDTTNGPAISSEAKSTQEELLFSGRNASYKGGPSFNDMIAIGLRGAVKASRTGSTIVAGVGNGQVDAVDTVARLRNLVQHQINKFEAGLESQRIVETQPGVDAKVPYATLDPKTGDRFSAKEAGNKFYFNPKSAQSTATMRAVVEDTNVGIRAYNALIQQFPDVYTGEVFSEVAMPEVATQSTSENNTVKPNEPSSTDSEQTTAQDSPEKQGTATQVSEENAAADAGNPKNLKELLDLVDSPVSFSLDRKLAKLIRNSIVFRNSALDIAVRIATPAELEGVSDSVNGWYDPLKKEIVLSDLSTTTALHEMVHAVTLEALNQNLHSTYDGTNRKLTKAEKAAKTLLEMANTFMDSEPKNATEKRVQDLMLGLINGDIQNKGVSGQVEAINEFMAYGLTDPGMAKSLRDLTQRSSLAQRIINAIKAILGFSVSENALDQLFFATKDLAEGYSNVAAPAPIKADKVEVNDISEPSNGTEEVKLQTPLEEVVSEQTTASPTSGDVDQRSTSDTTSSPVAEDLTSSVPETQAEVDLVIGANTAKGPDGKSVLLSSQSINPTMGYEDSLADLLDRAEALPYETGPELIGKLEAIEADVENMIDGMNKKLAEDIKNRVFTETVSKEGEEDTKNIVSTYLEHLAENQEGDFSRRNITGVRAGRVLALVDSQSAADGTPEYDRHLLKLALLAAVDYVLNTPNSTGTYKTEDIQEAMGLSKDRPISTEELQVFNFGRSASSVKETLGKHIRDFWNAVPNTQVSPNLSLGISEAVAEEIMYYLDTIGSDSDFFMRRASIEVGSGKTYNSFKLGDPDYDLGPSKTVLRDIAAPNAKTAHQYSIGVPFKDWDVADTLKKDKNILVPEEKRRAIKKQQETRFTLSNSFIDLYESVGPNAMAKILGFKAVDNSKFYNSFHRASVEGKNLSIRTSLNEVAEQVDRVRNYAQNKGEDAFSVPMYFKFEISLNGRFFMQGFSPQANKFAREMFTATEATFDLADSRYNTVFWAAVGQSLDQGDLKVENLGLDGSASYAKRLMDTRYRAAVDAIKNKEALGDTFPDVLLEALSDPEIEGSSRLLKGLLAVARYEQALERGDAQFTTDLPMELDGKTNGPISAAIQNNIEEFSVETLSLYQRGGLFVGGSDIAPKDYADFNKANDSADMYETVGDVMGRKVAQLNLAIKSGKALSNPADKPAALKAHSAVLRLIAEIGDVTFEERRQITGVDGKVVDVPGKLVINRKGTKSPITQQLYGAGSLSISQGLSQAIVKAVYEEITNAVRSKDGTRLKRMASLIEEVSSVDVSSKEGANITAIDSPLSFKGSLGDILQNKGSFKEWSRALEDFQIDPERFTRISNAVDVLYTSAFESALSETVGGSVKDVNDALVEATNIHANIYIQLVSRAIDYMTVLQRKPLSKRTEAELKLSKTVIGPGDEISTDARNRIIAKFAKYAPIIDTGISIFNLTSRDQETTVEVSAKRAAAREKGKYVQPTFSERSETLAGPRSASKRPSIGGAGVLVLPYSVISGADVAMQVDTWNNPNYPTQSLAVHDGNEFAITDLDAASLAMNEAVAKSWQTNTIKPVLESLDALLELQSALSSRGISAEQIAEVQASRDVLAEMSRQRQAKIDALATVSFRVDGVPGMQNPYIKADGLTFDSKHELVLHLNAEYAKNMRKENTLPESVEIEASEGSALRKALAASDFDGDVRSFIEEVSAVTTNPEQKAVLEEISKSPAIQEMIEAGLRIELDPAGSSVGGTFDAARRVITISNLTSETAIHELVHAATFFQIEQYYADPANVDPEQAKAVQRLESLMQDFRSRDFPEGTAESRLAEALSKAPSNIDALHEFLAWSLSNQQLISRGKIRIASDPLSQARSLGSKAIQLMRRMLGFTSSKVFDHVLFNAAVLMGKSPSGDVSSAVQRHVLYQQLAGLPDSDQRKAGLIKQVADRVAAFISEGSVERDERDMSKRLTDQTDAERKSLDALNRMGIAGFDISSTQDVHLFRSLYSAISMGLSLDKPAALEVEKLFEAVTSKITPESFLRTLGTTGSEATQGETLKADRMYRALTGQSFVDVQQENSFGPDTVANGLSDRLAVFVALAQTDSTVREVLSELSLKDIEVNTQYEAKSFDNLLAGVSNNVLGAFNRRVLNRSGSKDLDTTSAMDTLSGLMLAYDAEAATEIENTASSFSRRVNDKVKDSVESGARKLSDSLSALSGNIADDNSSTPNKLAAAALDISASLSDMLVGDRAEVKVDRLTSIWNNPAVPVAVREFWSEVRNTPAAAKGIYPLVKAARNTISRVRQETVEVLPKLIAKRFSEGFISGYPQESRKETANRLSKDWAHMHMAFGKTEFALLGSEMGFDAALELFGTGTEKQQSRRKAITAMQIKVRNQAEVLGLSKDITDRIVEAYKTKAKQLANYQVNSEVGVNLLTSAYAITGLFNEDGGVLSDNDYRALQGALNKLRPSVHSADFASNPLVDNLVKSIDTLASLEAVDLVDSKTHNRIAELAKTEPEGIKLSLSYLEGLYKQEAAKTDSVMAKVNGEKGYMKTNSRRKYSVLISMDTNHVDMVEQGFTRVRSYDAGTFESTGLSYYFSAHDKKANYNQGAMQTVQDTYKGIDPRTGRSIENVGLEIITGDEAKLISKRLKDRPESSGADGLVPVFTQYGALYGYERRFAPDMVNMLESSNNFVESLGVWTGRIQEEAAATGFNQGLMDALKEAYEVDKAEGKEDEYVAFGQEVLPDGTLEFTKELKDDPIWRESYLLIPKDARTYGHELFDGPIMVRRDMINNTLGYRSASITDVFTGNSRLYKEVQDTMRDVMLATPFIGKDMYKLLIQAEDLIQSVVSEVKHVIVVKSGVILAANTLSNVVQLASREVPLSYMAKRTKSKYAEVARYKDNEDEKARLRIEKVAARNKSEADRIQNSIDIIEESEKRMSIWPLIEANQFTTISEGLTDVDKALTDGKYMDWLEKKAAELPGSLSTVARYALISKDTALYKGMSRAVQYSDFIAKAVYYDFLTQERGISKEEALQKIDEEFINYDLADGRTRTYLESMGVTWFMNFKIRAIKIAASLAKDNPATALLSLGATSALGLSVGSPLNDNLVGAAADGKLGYSVGPGMVEAGWNLNLWKQMFG